MIASTDIAKITDRVARLFSMAVSSKINFVAITSTIERSDLATELQTGCCTILANHTAEELFDELFGGVVGIKRHANEIPASYDDAYWCGWVYMQLLFETRMPLPYLFLVLPLGRMLDIYPAYHEMDITQLFDLFETECSKSTVMKRVLKAKGQKVPALSKMSGVSANTINNYKKSDANLYAASFQNAFRLARSLNVPPELFLRQLPKLTE